MEDVDEIIMKKQWRWVGHIERMTDTKWAEKTIEWKPWGKK